jgi:hypothetical protein
MDIPRFDQHENKGAGANDLGEAFQKFAYEMLLFDYPDLHFFQGRGIDGAIDLARTKDGPRCVVECKYVGKDGLEETQRRWREVADKLRRNLSAAEGPAKKQYEPWYGTDSPVSEYVFCVSSEFKYLGQEDRLQQEIADFFSELSTRHTHLSHLSKLSVTVLDWNDLKARLRKHPHLLFHWFKLTRHYGLATLDEVTDYATFRSYLFSDKLPYYSRREHLGVARSPEGAEVLDEGGLLSLVEGERLTGIVLTGGGGIGKTRLTLEIGWLAQRAGWVVLRVLRRLKEDALEHLARWVTPETKVLLLIDYVETQRDFAELVDVLNDLNDANGLRLRYIANCRGSYYQTIATTERHREVKLSPATEDSATVGWLDDYQRQTVRHILEHSGIEVTERHLKVCRDIPVLAVFMSYLHSTGRQPALESLLEEENFARWIVKRLQLSFPGMAVFPNLAHLVALLPMPSTAALHDDLKDHGPFFDRLATDGWIEHFPVDEEYKTETWRAVHDVFADQILLFYFEGIPHTVENFVRGLLTLARRDVHDVLVRTSLLTPLQIINLLGHHEEAWQGAGEELVFQLRIGWLARWVLKQNGLELDEAQCSTLQSWLQKTASHATVNNYVLTSGIKFCPELVRDAALNWIRTRPLAFQTHYLMVAWLEQGLPTDGIATAVGLWSTKFSASPNLSFIAEAWLDAKGDKELLRAPIVAWLDAYKTLTEAQFVYRTWLDTGGDKETIREPMLTWLAAHATLAEADFVYRGWLDAGGDKETVSDSIAAWLAAYKTLAEARFVYKSWLDAGGVIDLIRLHLLSWLAVHEADTEAQFVYRAWLDAGGNSELIREPMLAWLDENGTLEVANFVYRGWLDAGGDKETIQVYLLAWLDEHGGSAESDFIFKAWLEKGGLFSIIRAHAIQWLDQHHEEESAGFLIKRLAKQADIPAETVKAILSWCLKFSDNEDVLWRLTQLGRHLLRRDAAEEVCATSEAILNLRLSDEAELTPVIKGQGTTLLAYLIEAPGLRIGHLRNRVDNLLLRWLRHPASFGTDPMPHRNVQRYSYVERIADLVDSGALSVVEDREALKRFMLWVDNWEPRWKLAVRPLIADLESRHPAPGLWDIVKFE